MPKRNYKIPFLRRVLNQHQCILQDQGPHYFSFRTIYKMSNPKDDEEVLDFEPYEDEAEDFSARAEDAGQHLTLTEDEAKSMEKECEASSKPGNVGAIALYKPPTLLRRRIGLSRSLTTTSRSCWRRRTPTNAFVRLELLLVLDKAGDATRGAREVLDHRAAADGLQPRALGTKGHALRRGRLGRDEPRRRGIRAAGGPRGLGGLIGARRGAIERSVAYLAGPAALRAAHVLPLKYSAVFALEQDELLALVLGRCGESWSR